MSNKICRYLSAASFVNKPHSISTMKKEEERKPKKNTTKKDMCIRNLANISVVLILMQHNTISHLV